MDALLLSGCASRALARAIATELDSDLEDVRLERFPDGEIQANVRDDVRGRHVYVVQSTAPPVADNLLELLFIADASRRAGASRVSAVIPYFGYARQDRRVRGSES